MKKKKFWAIIILLVVLANVGFLIFKILCFKHPKILDFTGIGHCLLAMILSLCLSIQLFFKFDKLRPVSQIVLMSFTIFIIIISGIYSAITSQLFSGVISETYDIERYLETDFSYDDLCASLFPKSVPENSTNRSYHYAYDNFEPIGTDRYIMAKWNLPKDEYEAEKSRIFSQWPNGVENYNEQSKLSDYFISYNDGFNLIFSYSDESNTAQYIYEGFEYKPERFYVYEYDRKNIETVMPT